MARTTLARTSWAAEPRRRATVVAVVSLAALLLAVLLSLPGASPAEPGRHGPLFAPQRWNQVGAATAALGTPAVESHA
jgi:hypothetical protein